MEKIYQELQSVTKVIKNPLHFHEKDLNMLDLLKDAQIAPPLWFNVVPSMEKLCQAVASRNGVKGHGCKFHYFSD